MAKKKSSGLGRGLDSLIPTDYYDENFDTNSSLSLEDMLEDHDGKNNDEKEDTKVEKEKIKEVSKDEESEDNKESEDEKEKVEEVSKNKESEDNKDTKVEKEKVEEVSKDKDSEDEKESIKEKSSENIETKPTKEETQEEIKSIKVDNANENITDEEYDTSLLEDENEIQEEDEEIDPLTQEHIDEVMEIVNKNPRITLWSVKSAAVFRYLRKTQPEFSISKEASSLIDEAVSNKYPEIWKLFEDQ